MRLFARVGLLAYLLTGAAGLTAWSFPTLATAQEEDESCSDDSGGDEGGGDEGSSEESGGDEEGSDEGGESGD